MGLLSMAAFDDDNGPAIVYLVRNMINRKEYLGVTRVGMQARQTKHIQNALAGQAGKFYAAIRKYGPEVFRFEVLCQCTSYQDALEAEREFIGTLAPAYNMTWGGEGILGYRHTDETKKKMSEAKGNAAPWAKGKCPPEVRAKLSASAKARKGTYNLSAARKDEMRVYAKRANDARRRAVVCLTDGLAFRSTVEAAAHYGVSLPTVLNRCRGVKLSRSRRCQLDFAYVDEVYL